MMAEGVDEADQHDGVSWQEREWENRTSFHIVIGTLGLGLLNLIVIPCITLTSTSKRALLQSR